MPHQNDTRRCTLSDRIAQRKDEPIIEATWLRVGKSERAHLARHSEPYIAGFRVALLLVDELAAQRSPEAALAWVQRARWALWADHAGGDHRRAMDPDEARAHRDYAKAEEAEWKRVNQEKANR